MTAASAPRGSYSERLARVIAAYRYDDLPPDVVAMMKDCILDQLGVQLVGSTLPWTRTVYDYALDMAGAGPCTVVGTQSRFSAPEAAFVNATFGHGCELDDLGHAGAAVIPAALAVAQQLNASGRELLTAVALGYDVFFRMFEAVMPQILQRGFHQQVVIGVFSSAAAASYLLKLSPEQMVHAFGIAGSHASATAEYDQSGGEVKRMHAGLGARGGVQSALLALKGLTGPSTIFEGKRGIFRTFVDSAREEKFTDGLGKRLMFTDHAAIKMFPTCASSHTSIQALGALIEKHGIKAEEVKQVDVGLSDYSRVHAATITIPTDVLSSQFCLAYSLALRLALGRNDLALYLDEKTRSDPRILALCRKVSVRTDPSATGDRLTGSLVTVHTHDGRTFEHYEQYRKGSRENPATPDELRKKFFELSGAVLQKGPCEQVAQRVGNIENAAGIRPLMDLLAAGPKIASGPRLAGSGGAQNQPR